MEETPPKIASFVETRTPEEVARFLAQLGPKVALNWVEEIMHQTVQDAAKLTERDPARVRAIIDAMLDEDHDTIDAGILTPILGAVAVESAREVLQRVAASRDPNMTPREAIHGLNYDESYSQFYTGIQGSFDIARDHTNVDPVSVAAFTLEAMNYLAPGEPSEPILVI